MKFSPGVSFLLRLTLSVIFFTLTTSIASAADCSPNTINASIGSAPKQGQEGDIVIYISGPNNLNDNYTYYFNLKTTLNGPKSAIFTGATVAGPYQIHVSGTNASGTHTVTLNQLNPGMSRDTEVCTVGTITFEKATATCSVKTDKPQYQRGETVLVTAELPAHPGGPTPMEVCINDECKPQWNPYSFIASENKPYYINIQNIDTSDILYKCSTSIMVCEELNDNCESPPTPAATSWDLPQFKVCQTIPAGPERTKCVDCIGNDPKNVNKIWTGLGCIPISAQGFTSSVLTIGLAAGGGLALLLMFYGAFLVSTSAGDPEKSQKGKEVFGGAVAGLLFIVFSVVLLKIIGIDILQIPGI